jgi:ubiquinone biosynthesis monooxygenase Coq7
MKQDEVKHRVNAEHRGAQALPVPLRSAMRVLAKVMTKTAYRI